MSDTDDTGDGGIRAKVYAWGYVAYEYAGWAYDAASKRLLGSGGSASTATDTPAPPPPAAELAPPEPEPTAMQVFKETLSPRPDALKAPADATTDETQAIDKGFLELTTYVDDNLDSAEPGTAEQMRDALATLVEKTTKAIADRKAFATQKPLLETKLAKIPLPKDIPPADQRSFAKRRSKAATALSRARNLNDLTMIDGGIDTLADDVKTAQKLAPLRKEAAREIDAARKSLNSLRKTVDRGYCEALGDAIADAAKALASAKTESDIVKLRQDLKKITDKEADARSYAADYDSWCFAAEGFLSVYAADPDKETRSDARKAYNVAIAAAAAKTAKLDFAAARSVLDGFKLNPDVTGAGDFAGASAFLSQLDSFMQSHNEKRLQVKAARLPWSNRLDTALSDIRKKGIRDKLWVDAGTELTDYEDKVVKLYPIALKHLEVMRSKGGVPDNAEPMATILAAVQTSKSALNTDGSGDYAAAMAPFNGLDADIADKAQALRRLSAIKTRADALGTAGLPDSKAYIALKYPDIVTDISGDLPEAQKTMTGLEKTIDDIEALLPVLTEARAAKQLHDPADAFELLKEAEAKRTAHQYDKALKQAEAALEGYGKLSRFLHLERQVTLVRDAQADPSDGHKAAADAVTEAGELARTDGKIAEAIARLETVLDAPSLAEGAHEAGIWVEKYDAIEKRHLKIVPPMEPPAAKIRMAQLFAAIQQKAQTDKDYPAAVALLEAYARKLDEARAYVASRRSALSVKGGLDRAADTFSAVDDVDKKVYGDGGKDGLGKKVDAAEKLATAGKIAEAGKAFDKLLKEWQPLLKNCAILHEAEDANGSNAGHSIDRHGPEVTDEELITRVTTGIAPDGKMSATKAASRFDTYAAWMQAREEGASMLEDKVHPGPPPVPVKVTDTSVPAAADAFVSMKEVIDHGGPIDRAMRATRPGVSIDANTGKIGKSQTAETFEAVDGITKSETLWLFEFDISAIKTELDQPHGDKPKGTGIRWDSKPGTYIDAYRTLNTPPTDPPNIPGKWVMMQLYPVVDKWNQEKQEYDT